MSAKQFCERVSACIQGWQKTVKAKIFVFNKEK